LLGQHSRALQFVETVINPFPSNLAARGYNKLDYRVSKITSPQGGFICYTLYSSTFFSACQCGLLNTLVTGNPWFQVSDAITMRNKLEASSIV